MTTFNEVKSSLEQTIADPLLALRAKIATLNDYHNHCVQQCQDAINALINGTDGQPAWQGPGGQAVAENVANYLSAARAVSGTDTDPYGSFMDGYMLKPVQIGETIANELYNSLETITGPRQIASIGLSIPSSGSLPTPSSTTVDPVDPVGEFVVGIDTGAVLQGGIDVPWDVVAGLATAGYLIYKAATYNPDQAHIDLANEYAAEAEQMYKDQITTYRNTEPLKRLPDSPKGPNGDFSKFLIAIGVGVTLVSIAGVTVYNILFKDLPEKQQKRLIQNLSKQYGCTPAEIQAILDKYQGKVSPEQLERILQILQIKAQLQDLLAQTQGSTLNGIRTFQASIQGDINAIENSDPSQWTKDNLTGWQNNYKGMSLQWQEVQSMDNPSGVEQRTQNCGGRPFNVDIAANDTWYEVKGAQVHYDDSNYLALLNELKKYIQAGGCENPPIRNFGTVVLDGSDPNLGHELENDLAKYKIFVHLDVVNTTWKPQVPGGSGWCTLP